MSAARQERPRTATTYESVALGFLRWGAAVRSGDERAVRLESRVLASELTLLSCTDPLLLPHAGSQRLRIASEAGAPTYGPRLR